MVTFAVYAFLFAKLTFWLAVAVFIAVTFAGFVKRNFLRRQPKGRASVTPAFLKHFNLKIFLAVLLNFAVFFAVHAVLLQGDAWNGGIESGQYILHSSSERHKVSAGIWFYSLAHTWISMMSMLLLFLVPEIKSLFATQDSTPRR